MKQIIKYTLSIILLVVLSIVCYWSLSQAFINIEHPISLALLIIGIVSLFTLLAITFLLIFEWCITDINDPVEDKSSEGLDKWED